MKYEDTTQEQRESITPYLLGLFKDFYRFLNLGLLRQDLLKEILAYQQAQKAEIESLSNMKTHDIYLNARFYKLKFESELE